MTGPERAERARVDDFYGRKWRGHSGLWEERYPPDQRVYAVSLYRRRNEEILRSIEGPVGSALDLGCGVGDVALLLAGRGGPVTAADVSWTNVERARRNLERTGAGSARVVQSDAGRLPFSDGSFDVVVLADVIEHVPDPSRALSEIRRVLGPGGRLVCVTPLRGALAVLRTLEWAARKVARPARREPIAWTNPDVFERFASKREMRRALAAAGFHVERFRRICFYPAPETPGAFGALMGRLSRRAGPRRFAETADRVIRAFARLERLGVLNQKQLWVVR